MNKETDELIQEFVARGGNAQDWTPAYSVAPTNSAPIIREWQPSDEDAPVREVELARWDFKPGAGTSPSRQIINARFEKLADRFWVGSFSNTRAIVPMLGYYEWTGEKGSKQPHFIRSDELLAAAGMYTSHPTEDGGWRREFVIITREARDASGEIHDRMPAFLTPDTWDQWLSPASLTVKGKTAESQANRQELIAMLDRSSLAVASTIRTYPVDKRVSNVRTLDRSDPTLIDPVDVDA